MGQPLIELQDVVVERKLDPTGPFGLWGARPVRALDGISLRLARGETLGLMGGSGAGKSTLAETVTFRLQPTRGQVLVEGQSVGRVRGGERRRLLRRFALIRQDARESLQMEQTVDRQFKEWLSQAGLPDPAGRVARALEQVELPAAFLDRTPAQMSGGEQQRLAMARALATSPVLLAADEPVSGVDPLLQQELLALLERTGRRENLACLLISQEPRVIRRLAHRVAVMDAGQLYELGTAERLFSEARHPYSRLLLGLDPGLLPAEAETAGRRLTGCPFAAHCPVALERCRTERPVMREVAPGQAAACHAL